MNLQVMFRIFLFTVLIFCCNYCRKTNYSSRPYKHNYLVSMSSQGEQLLTSKKLTTTCILDFKSKVQVVVSVVNCQYKYEKNCSQIFVLHHSLAP